MRALVIYNPVSGKTTKYDICKLYDEMLKNYGYDVTILKTRYACHAEEILKDCPYYDIVFSVGGDGTLNEVVTGNLRRKEKLNICPLPSGTCNDVASMLGYGTDPRKNMNDALNGELHDFDIGTINDKPFVYVAGCGKFMNIPYETGRSDKAKIGYLSYIKEATKELVKKTTSYKADISVDGIELNGQYSMIMVSNSNHIAGISNFYKNVSLNDSKFEILLCKSNNIADMAVNFAKFYLGIKTDKIISLNGHDINIKVDNNSFKSWCIDGEKMSQDTHDYVIKVDSKVKLLMPKKAIKRNLFNS